LCRNELHANVLPRKAFYAREAILEYLDDLEDICLAEKRLEDLRGGRTRTYTLEEVERDLGLGD